ncbi:MAG TPA: PEP-CTERM sorting domain-containing protein [Rhodoferax sp.]
MNLKSLRYLLAVGLITMAGYSWATASPPKNDDPTWQDIASIQWSTNNGGTWGNSALVVGQSVEFKVTMHKNELGNHYADLLKVWIDTSGEGQFQADEAVLFGAHVDNASVTPWDRPEGNAPGYNQSFVFTSGPVNLTNAMLGDHFLLARVTCSESLLTTELGSSYSWDKQWGPSLDTYKSYFSPTAHYYQGESELVKLTVNSVPEPGTLALVTVAMLGMGWRRKQTTHI